MLVILFHRNKVFLSKCFGQLITSWFFFLSKTRVCLPFVCKRYQKSYRIIIVFVYLFIFKERQKNGKSLQIKEGYKQFHEFLLKHFSLFNPFHRLAKLKIRRLYFRCFIQHCYLHWFLFEMQYVICKIAENQYDTLNHKYI